MPEIYGLYHPETGEIRYVGKANDSEKRLKSHLRDANSRKTPLYSWIRSLSKSGLVPVVRVLEVADNWQAKEKELIALHRASGARLLNVAEGGDEPFCSKETRAANGKANAAKREADPVLRELHRFFRDAGEIAAYYRKQGNTERAEKVVANVQRIKSGFKGRDEDLYVAIVARRELRREAAR